MHSFLFYQTFADFFYCAGIWEAAELLKGQVQLPITSQFLENRQEQNVKEKETVNCDWPIRIFLGLSEIKREKVIKIGDIIEQSRCRMSFTKTANQPSLTHSCICTEITLLKAE